ncbi:MAG: hypothetical protein Q8K68_13290, partial [Nitrospirota bacterium]|nr:hypothetical protein [Nitrospirota bacterium]
NDIDTKIEKIGALIMEIDQEHMQARQVMIEAKIVEVNVNYSKELGIKWGMFWRGPTTSGDNNFIISKDGTNNMQTITPGTAATATTPATPASVKTTIDPVINLPAAVGLGAGGSIGFGYIHAASNLVLNMQLSALESTKNGKVLSNPRIMTMNNAEAKITQGRTIYVPTATADKIEFKAIDALLSLTVKPRIAPGGAIFMDLDITKDEPGTATAGGVDILKNTVKTSVLVNNSDTVVIGGVFKNSEIDSTDGIPGLSKLPLIGRLFRKEGNAVVTNEVLIFITPTIINFQALK